MAATVTHQHSGLPRADDRMGNRWQEEFNFTCLNSDTSIVLPLKHLKNADQVIGSPAITTWSQSGLNVTVTIVAGPTKGTLRVFGTR